jgi:hypothetical protein
MPVRVSYRKADARADVGTTDAIYIRRNPLIDIANRYLSQDSPHDFSTPGFWQRLSKLNLVRCCHRTISLRTWLIKAFFSLSDGLE